MEQNNLFDSFNLNEQGDDNTDTEPKFFELPSYSTYLEEKENKTKKKKEKPKELKLKENFLKIIPFKSNKSKIPQRPLMKKNIIPAHPFRLLLVGRSGSGKSMNLINLMSRPHFYGRTDPDDKKTGYFDEIFLFSPTAEGGDDLADFLELNNKRIITDENQFLPVLEHILKTQKQLINKKSIVKSPKICLIFDDCQSAERFLKSQNFIKIFIAGRHYNISVICCGQSWTKFSRVTRLNSSNIMLYPSSNSEIDLLCEEYCPPNCSKKQFKALIQHATANPYEFLHINNQVKISEKYRKNLDVILSINKD